MSTCIVDASVAVRWLVSLPGHEQARALLTSGHRLAAPELLAAEVGSALAKLVRGNVLTREEGTEALQDFFRAPVRMLPIRPAAGQAWQMAQDHAQSFYDCLYLAMAVMADGLFATADARFWNAMKSTIYAKHLLGIPYRA